MGHSDHCFVTGNSFLKNLYQEEQTSGPTVAGSNKDLRTSICFLALASDNAKDMLDLEYCEGLKMTAMEDGGPAAITLTEATFDKDLGERACIYREYFRQCDIYQRRGIKSN